MEEKYEYSHTELDDLVSKKIDSKYYNIDSDSKYDYGTRDQQAYSMLDKEEQKQFNKINFQELFYRNGWGWFSKDNLKNAEVYTNVFTINYGCKIHAIVSSNFTQMGTYGELGIMNLEVENEFKTYTSIYNIEDLKNMTTAIVCAEKHLVKLGIPFIKNYTFHQDSEKENLALQKENQKTIKKLGLDKLEELRHIAYERLNEKERLNETDTPIPDSSGKIPYTKPKEIRG